MLFEEDKEREKERASATRRRTEDEKTEERETNPVIELVVLRHLWRSHRKKKREVKSQIDVGKEDEKNETRRGGRRKERSSKLTLTALRQMFLLLTTPTANLLAALTVE